MNTIPYQSVFAVSRKRRKTVVVDFDGTIAEDRHPEIGKPMPGVKAALKKLVDAGYEVVVFTCRMTRAEGRTKAEALEQKQDIAEWLDENNIPYSRIDDGSSGKPMAQWYVDNKNLEYHGGNDWDHLSAFILSQGN